MNQKIIIETERLFLRKIEENDSSNLMELFSDPIAMQFFLSTKTKDEVNEWIKKKIDSYIYNKFGLYLCVLKETSQVIGYCGLTLQKDVDGKDEIEIGYGLIRSFWHKGFATEAAIGCKNYGFDELNLKRLISLIRPENLPSINVAIRNGMLWNKNIRRWNYLHGVYVVCKK